MARFARPYCATEPVRTVPFFNLYDDIQITQLGAYNDRFQRDMQAPLTGFHARVVQDPPTPGAIPAPLKKWGGVCPATISSAPLGTPQVTPNDTSAPESGPFGRPGTVPSNPSELNRPGFPGGSIP